MKTKNVFSIQASPYLVSFKKIILSKTSLWEKFNKRSSTLRNPNSYKSKATIDFVVLLWLGIFVRVYIQGFSAP
jgi:hypothetical protein